MSLARLEGQLVWKFSVTRNADCHSKDVELMLAISVNVTMCLQ